MSQSRSTVAVVVALIAAACGSDKSTGPGTPTFLKGTPGNPQIGLVISSLSPALTLFQLGKPTNTETIPLGASQSITPVGFSINGTTAVVPLGDAASVAVINLNTQAITNYQFTSGNATGQAFVDANTVIVSNEGNNYVGVFTLTQSGTAITDTVTVATTPSDIETANGNAYVISANLDANGSPLGNGVVTKLNGHTLAVLGTATTGGENSSAAAIGPDGRLYVLNTGDFVGQATVTVMDTATLALVGNGTYTDFGVGSGAITIDGTGLAYVSSFFGGTVIWNTVTQSFVRSNTNALCVVANNVCLGAFGAAPDAAGDVYQVYFGSNSSSGKIYVYTHGSYALSDSVNVGQTTGPSAIRIATF
jgi:hypothetical protein